MGTTERILLGALLLAIASLPVAVFLYLRTAFRKGGWKEVKSAAMVAGSSILIWAGISLWPEFEIRHILRALRHPFALSSICFLAVMVLAHFALKAWKQTHDNN